MMTENLTLVTTKDKVQIAVWEIFDSQKTHQCSNVDTNNGSARNDTVKNNTANQGQNIFLTHGTFSDKNTCLRIAEYQLSLAIIVISWSGVVMVQARYQKTNLTLKPSQPTILLPLSIIYLMN